MASTAKGALAEFLAARLHRFSRRGHETRCELLHSLGYRDAVSQEIDISRWLSDATLAIFTFCTLEMNVPTFFVEVSALRKKYNINLNFDKYSFEYNTNCKDLHTYNKRIFIQ